jgi:uncharacterized protein YjbI with pentapeptide repeats
MANQEQVERLRQGVEGWNKWRKENPYVQIDLSKADLMCNNLRGANLTEALLHEAQLGGTILCEANLYAADISFANLDGTDLYRVHLFRADLRRAILFETNFFNAVLGSTLLVDLDLSETIGLDNISHLCPSQLSTETLLRSKGRIPEKFLRGCGLSEWEVESAKLYRPGLSSKETDDILYRIHDLRVGQALQINPLFISYSHKDSAFVDKVENHLDEKGIRFWRDIHDATAGRLEKVVDRAMRMNPTVLLVLSENSVKSDWVEHEAREARELEKELGRDVLCPVALDDAWEDCKWPERLREQIMEYNILDFSKWKDEGEFEKKFRKLVDGLDLFYKEE